MKKFLKAVLSISLALVLLTFASCSKAPNEQNNNDVSGSNASSARQVLTYSFDTTKGTIVDSSADDDGSYTESMLYDSVLYVTTMRMAQEDGTALDIVNRMFSNYYDETEETEGIVDEKYASKEISFTIGSEEDTDSCRLILIKGNGYDYAFIAQCPIDYYEDYAAAIQDMVNSLKLIDEVVG